VLDNEGGCRNFPRSTSARRRHRPSPTTGVRYSARSFESEEGQRSVEDNSSRALRTLHQGRRSCAPRSRPLQQTLLTPASTLNETDAPARRPLVNVISVKKMRYKTPTPPLPPALPCKRVSARAIARCNEICIIAHYVALNPPQSPRPDKYASRRRGAGARRGGRRVARGEGRRDGTGRERAKI